MPDESTQAMSDAPGREITADIDALATLMPIVCERMHWGLKKVDNQVTALRAEALTPDDRSVEIRAQTVDGGTDVQVKVGFFGSAAEEQQFFDALTHVLAEVKRKP